MTQQCVVSDWRRRVVDSRALGLGEDEIDSTTPYRQPDLSDGRAYPGATQPSHVHRRQGALQVHRDSGDEDRLILRRRRVVGSAAPDGARLSGWSTCCTASRLGRLLVDGGGVAGGGGGGGATAAARMKDYIEGTVMYDYSIMPLAGGRNWEPDFLENVW